MKNNIQQTNQFTRRSFVRSAALASASLLMQPTELFSLHGKKNIGLQLYTLRKIINEKNVEQVLERIAAIGYKELELFGYDPSTKFWGYEPASFKKLLKRYGLKAPSAHIGFEPFLAANDVEGFKSIADAAVKLGNKYLVVAWLGEQYRSAVADYELLANKLQEASLIAKSMGLQMAYHNHDFEFNILDQNKTGYDILLAGTDPQSVKMELDIYWCSKAGVDAIQLFKKYPGRFPLWHVKDMNGVTKDFTEVGSGVIDYRSVFQHASVAGLKHFFVEQDEIKGDGWQSIGKSYAYVKNHLLPRLSIR